MTLEEELEQSRRVNILFMRREFNRWSEQWAHVKMKIRNSLSTSHCPTDFSSFQGSRAKLCIILMQADKHHRVTMPPERPLLVCKHCSEEVKHLFAVNVIFITEFIPRTLWDSWRKLNDTPVITYIIPTLTWLETVSEPKAFSQRLQRSASPLPVCHYTEK